MATTKAATKQVRKPLTSAQKKRKNELAKKRRDAKKVQVAVAPEPMLGDEIAHADAVAEEIATDAPALMPEDNTEGNPEEAFLAAEDALDEMLEARAKKSRFTATGRLRPAPRGTATNRWWKRRTTSRMTKQELVAAVRQVAAEQYNSGRGWDYVVEAFSDEDILNAMGRVRSVRGAVWNVGNAVLAIARREAEVKSL